MIIYNVTIKVESSIAREWLAWLKEEHINDMLGTGCFTKAVILNLLEPEDSEGYTYAIQYYAEDKNSYDTYIERYADDMRNKGFRKWGDKFVAFRSLMEVVN